MPCSLKWIGHFIFYPSSRILAAAFFKFYPLMTDQTKTRNMKYPIHLIIIAIPFFAACENQVKQGKETGNKQTDSITPVSKQSPADTESSKVRSEAPDALTKTEDGYALAKFDDGIAQSPINILSSNTEKENKHEIIVKFNDEINAVENLGHTIQLNFKEGSTINVDGITYQFKQLHFHTPSEHLIDGITYPLEMHVVTQKNSGDTAYIVMAMLFKMGRENKFIKEFLNAIPAEKNKKENLQPGVVKLNDLFTGISKNALGTYYHYKGSLTTPPYTESVDWIIRKYIFEAAPTQISSMEKIEGDNARHIHALRQRKVGSN
jgi:carbonic anhydrase